MKRLGVVCLVLVSTLTFAQDKKGQGAHGQPAQMGQGQSMQNPSTAWTPRQVTKEDKKGLTQTMDALDAAWMKQDVNAAASFVDFPVMMVTDDSKGVVTSGWWAKEKWMEAMVQGMQSMPKDMAKPKTKNTSWFVSDSLVRVDSEHSWKMGGKSMNTRSTSLWVLKDGKWMLKSMVDPGWGEAMKPSPNAQQGMR